MDKFEKQFEDLDVQASVVREQRLVAARSPVVSLDRCAHSQPTLRTR